MIATVYRIFTRPSSDLRSQGSCTRVSELRPGVHRPLGRLRMSKRLSIMLTVAFAFGLPIAASAPASAQSYPLTCQIGTMNGASVGNTLAGTGGWSVSRHPQNLLRPACSPASAHGQIARSSQANQPVCFFRQLVSIHSTSPGTLFSRRRLVGKCSAVPEPRFCRVRHSDRPSS